MEKKSRIKKKTINRGNKNIRMVITRFHTPLERKAAKQIASKDTSCYYQYKKRWRLLLKNIGK
jgi:hypothetical protein